MAFKIITDIRTLDELWRAGVLYVSCSSPSTEHTWVLDTEDPAPISEHVRGWELLDCGTWVIVYHEGLRDEYKLHNTWAIQVEE